MRCPSCDHDNIPGVDACASCGSDLAGLDTPEREAGHAGRLMTDEVGALMLAQPLCVPPVETVGRAIERMREAGHGCALVEAEGRLVGIFTERDVLHRVVRPGLDPATTPVAAVMTPEPMTLEPHDPTAFAIHRMAVSGLRHLPVADEGQILGLVSVRGLLRYLDRDLLIGG